jgi:predicted HTH transcriptional regulator
MLDLIWPNPNILIFQFVLKINLSEQVIKKNLKKHKDKNLIRRVGSNKNGYWEIIE